MSTRNKWFGSAVLVCALALAGCGGGGGGGIGAAAPDIGQDVNALVAYLQSLIAGTDETSEPIAIDALTLAVDDTAEPAPL